MSEEEDNAVGYVVSTVNTSEGLRPAVIAMHEIIGKRLEELLEALEYFVTSEQPTVDGMALINAYYAYVRSPQEIIDNG